MTQRFWRYATSLALAPRLASAHKLAPRGPEECLWLIEHTFNDLIFELRANVPTYSRWLAEHEADVDIHQYYRRQLQMLGAHCNGSHWVFKAPRHLPGLAGLLAVFPEARIVQTHRNPADVLPSLCSLCEILRSAASEKTSRREGIRTWIFIGSSGEMAERLAGLGLHEKPG